MFPKPKRKKQCRSLPATAKSKFKPLPNIGSDRKNDVPPTCMLRNRTETSGTPRSRNSRSCNQQGPLLVRTGKFPGHLGGREIGHYVAFGKSSDVSAENCPDHAQLPDPYAELQTNLDSAMPLDPNAPWWLFLAEMRLQARRQAVKLDVKADIRMEGQADWKLDGRGEGGHKPKADKENKEQTDASKSVLVNNNAAGGEPAGRPGGERTAPDKENKNKEDAAENEDNANDNDDDDDEDEEGGLPQAVRALQPKASTPNAREVLRERHKARMEEIARSVPKKDLLINLRASGFFHYDYVGHARTNMNNHNLKNGKKKGIERLLTLLTFKTTKCASELYGN